MIDSSSLMNTTNYQIQSLGCPLPLDNKRSFQVAQHISEQNVSKARHDTINSNGDPSEPKLSPEVSKPIHITTKRQRSKIGKVTKQ